MITNVKLEDIIEQIDFAGDSHKSFFNKITGEIHLISDEDSMHCDEDFEEDEFIPEWQKEIIRIAKDISEHSENYIQLPDQWDIHEYSIMEKFCLSLTDEALRDEMYNSIKGKGAFRIFKDNIHRFGIAEDWYKYKDDAFREIAIEWCNENNLEYY